MLIAVDAKHEKFEKGEQEKGGKVFFVSVKVKSWLAGPTELCAFHRKEVK